MPTNLREISHHQKISGICGIRVGQKNTTKAWTRVKKKGSEGGWVPLPSEPFLEKNYCYLLWFLCFDNEHKGGGYHKVNTCQSEHIRL